VPSLMAGDTDMPCGQYSYSRFVTQVLSQLPLQQFTKPNQQLLGFLKAWPFTLCVITRLLSSTPTAQKTPLQHNNPPLL
jgi:hypothetical protein